MSILSKIKSYYLRFRSYHLSTSKSILIAGVMVSLSILSGTEEIRQEIDYNTIQISRLLGHRDPFLYEINESIKAVAEKSGAPVTLDQDTFNSVFEICMRTTSTLDENGFTLLDSQRQKHCLNKILKTDIK